MSSLDLEPYLLQVERYAVVQVLRAHPHWTIGEVADHLRKGGPLADLIRDVRIDELIRGSDSLEPSPDGGPPIDRGRLEAAKLASGADYDALVLAVLREAGGEVSATYLRARVGGPRWKLRGALGRLMDAGVVDRSGVTSSTRWRVIEGA